MKEDLLHFIWQQKVLVKHVLKTTCNKPVEILKPGSLNKDSGPDFFDARIRIAGTLWAGNVEIHRKSSDWIRHKHDQDHAYSNVILHVVYDHDKELGLPTLELKNYLTHDLLKTYQQLRQSALEVPCQNVLALPDALKLDYFLSRLAVERLEDKCELLEEQLYRYNSGWEKLFYVTLARYFGMKVNAAPFVQLAENLPAQLLARHRNNRCQVDALIFGTAGFLPAPGGHPYIDKLNREFSFLQAKYQLPRLGTGQWKFARTRPANFPTIRLAQFSALVHRSTHLFGKLMQTGSIGEANSLLQTAELDLRWLNELFPALHPPKAVMGEAFIRNLLVNAVVPVKFLYGKHTLSESLCEQALTWLEQLEPEENSIVNFWKSNGIKAGHALHSQALIQLHTRYCARHQCLRCEIGNHILHQHV